MVGEVHFRGDLNPGTQGASGVGMSIPYIAGLNSLQAIRSVPKGTAANQQTAYVNGCSLNKGGAEDDQLHPNVVQVRIENGRVHVDIMNVLERTKVTLNLNLFNLELGGML